MRKLLVAAMGAAAFGVTAFSNPAAAGLSYAFNAMGTSPAGLPISVQITFADPAVSVSGDRFNGGFGGILDFLFKAGTFEADLGDLIAIQATCDLPNPLPCDPLRLNYALAPSGGSMLFNNGSSDFEFQYAGAQLWGTFNTDFVGPEACRTTDVCSFRGEWQTVDEPAGLALLAGGLLLAGAFRRRT